MYGDFEVSLGDDCKEHSEDRSYFYKDGGRRRRLMTCHVGSMLYPTISLFL